MKFILFFIMFCFNAYSQQYIPSDINLQKLKQSTKNSYNNFELGSVNKSSIIFFVDNIRKIALEARIEDEKNKSQYDSLNFHINDNPCIKIAVKQDEEKFRIPNKDELILFYSFKENVNNTILYNNIESNLVKVFDGEDQDRLRFNDDNKYNEVKNGLFWLTSSKNNINSLPYSINLFTGQEDTIAQTENNSLRVRCIRTIYFN